MSYYFDTNFRHLTINNREITGVIVSAVGIFGSFRPSPARPHRSTGIYVEIFQMRFPIWNQSGNFALCQHAVQANPCLCGFYVVGAQGAERAS
jgi:hypothetical protein